MKFFHFVLIIFASCIFSLGYAQTDDDETEEDTQNSSAVTYAPNFDVGTMLSNFSADVLGSTGMTALTDGLMGESYDVNSGSITFLQSDVSLPGNSKLPVRFARRASGVSHDGGNVPYISPLGKGWDVDIPYIVTRVDQGKSGNCNSVKLDSYRFTSLIARDALDIGTKIYTPGAGERDLGEPLDIDGITFYKTRKMATRDHWIATCVSNSTSTSGGGYTVKSPDGMTYVFDHIKTRSTTFSLPTPSIYVPDSYDVDNIYMMPTEVTDVHGNWVKYEYNSHGVTRIHSNDGREITVSYSGALITSVTANQRVWTYAYDNNNLSRVTLPDGNYWSFGANEEGIKYNGLQDGDCYNKRLTEEYNTNFDGRTISMTHPNGTEAEFETRVIVNYVKNVPAGGPFGPAAGYGPGSTACVAGKVRPSTYFTRALVRKTLNISSGETYLWSYDYDQPASTPFYQQSGSKHFHNDTSQANDTKIRTVTDPENYKTVYHLNNDWVTEAQGTMKLGALVKKERFDNAGGNTSLRTETTDSYVSTNELGGRMSYGSTIAGSDYLFLPTQRTVIQDGDTWTYEYEYEYDLDPNSIDFAFTSPIVTKVSSNISTNPRITVTDYYHDYAKYIVGLPEKITMNDREMASYSYNAKGLMTSEKRFGQSYFDYHYYGIGNLYSATDAIGRQTVFFYYKRGRPERVRRTDLSNVRQTIDDNGWVTSSTDPRGNTTGYGHDEMGRVTSVTPPSSWDSTSITYDFTGGGATQTIEKGSDNTLTISYDSLLRPISEQSSTSLVTSYTGTNYDKLGRVIFQSRPSSGSNPTSGTNYTYDALGRVLTESDTDMYGPQVTHEYTSDHVHKVSDSEGGRTDYYSYGYDGPGNTSYKEIEKFDNGSLIQHNGLTKNVWGQLTSATQTDYSGFGNSVVQTFDYDSRQRLCRKTVPEQGATHYQYNDAGELTAYSKGTGNIGCGNVGTSLARVDLTYDLLGRPLNTLFTDPNTPDIRRTYWSNSDNIRTVWRDDVGKGTVRWNYYYHDEADLVDYESLKIDGKTYISTYEYDSSGALEQERLPSGRRIDYTSDGAGRFNSIQYGSTTLASNFSYHPNGALAGMSYGNGQNFTQTLNNRQLPSGMYSLKNNHTAIDQTYDYDSRGLITSMTDNATNIGSTTENNNRLYGYDGLGRLTSATGPWGTGFYDYDGLNNLRTKTLGTRTVDLSYDTTNRLETSEDTGDSGDRTFSHDNRGNVTAITHDNSGIVTRELNYAPGTSWVHTAQFTNSGNKLLSLKTVATASNLIPEETTAYFEGMSPGETQERYMHVYIPGTNVNAIVLVRAEFLGGYVLNIWHETYPDTGGVATRYHNENGNAWINTTTPSTPSDDLTFTYDFSDQPVTVSGKSNGEYLYDGNMKRVRAIIDDETFHYIYNSMGRLSYVHKVSAGGSTERTEYVAGPQGSLARFDGWKLTYLHPDHLGSVQSGTDTLGRVIWREKYTPFGEEISSPAANDNLAGFTGHIRDKATGLNYMQARYYDPVVGRFLSIDPVDFMQSGNPANFNRYSYAFNDPINIIDPDGRYGWSPGEAERALEFGATPAGGAVRKGAIFAAEVGLTGGIGGTVAKQGATRAISGLSNQAKGKLGETILRAKLALKGQKVIATQRKASEVPGLENVTGRGANSVVDFAVRGKDGATKVIDAKFTTTGRVSNTGAQRDLKSQIGDSFSNAVVHGDDVAAAVGGAGAVVGGAAGAANPYSCTGTGTQSGC